MSAAENKRIVSEYFQKSANAPTSEFANLLADDFVYRCRGMTPETNVSRSKEDLLRAIEGAPGFWKEPVTISIEQMTAEDDRVAVQAESRGVLNNGTEYRNSYHFLIHVRDGQIRSLDEYFCTATFLDVVFSRRGTGAGG